MQSLQRIVNEFLQEIRSNRKLQYGLLAIALLACVELGLGWSDALSAKEKQLLQLRSELRALRNQSRNEEALRSQLVELESVERTIDQRLWIVSSDAVGQARLKDWLAELLKKAGAKNFNLVLSSPRAVGAREGSAGSEPTVVGKSEASTSTGGGVAARDVTKSLREVRANITLVFTPATLEQVLSDIEGGEPFASVESLNVSRRDRKIDMTVRVLMQIGPQKISGTSAVNESEAESAQGASDSKAPQANTENKSTTGLPQQSVNGAAEAKR